MDVGENPRVDEKGVNAKGTTKGKGDEASKGKSKHKGKTKGRGRQGDSRRSETRKGPDQDPGGDGRTGSIRRRTSS